MIIAVAKTVVYRSSDNRFWQVFLAVCVLFAVVADSDWISNVNTIPEYLTRLLFLLAAAQNESNEVLEKRYDSLHRYLNLAIVLMLALVGGLIGSKGTDGCPPNSKMKSTTPSSM